MSVTEGLRVGDTVVHSRTMEVKFAKDGYVELHDTVEPTIRIGLHDSHKGSDVIKIVRKAKPQVGDIVTGGDVQAIQWRRGTTIASVKNPDYVYVLQENGTWLCSNGAKNVSFQCFGDLFRGKLLHVA